MKKKIYNRKCLEQIHGCYCCKHMIFVAIEKVNYWVNKEVLKCRKLNYTGVVPIQCNDIELDEEKLKNDFNQYIESEVVE